MAYNTIAIKKDVDGKPVPQLYNEVTDEYEVLKGQNGASRTMLYDADGNPIDLVGLITTIINILNQNNLPVGAATADNQEAIKAILESMYSRDTTQTFYGKSTDEKPSEGVVIGSIFFEIDTKTVYMYDGTNWVVI